MKQCPKCGKKFADHVKFCQTDGTPLVEMIDPSKRRFCSHCGAPNDKKSKFCKSCGKPMDAAKPQAIPQPNQQPAQAHTKQSESIPEKAEVSVPPQQTQPVTPTTSAEDSKPKEAQQPDPQPKPAPIQSAAAPAEHAIVITSPQQAPVGRAGAAEKISASQKTAPGENNLLWILICILVVLLLTGSGYYFRSYLRPYLNRLLPQKEGSQEQAAHKEDKGQEFQAPVRVENAFPFEGGQLGVWHSKKELTAYASEGNTSTVAFVLGIGEKFEALERNIHVDQPGIVKINDSVQISVRDKSPEGKALERQGLQKGDTIGLICPAGEGYSYILVNGKIAAVYNIFDTNSPKAEYIRKEGSWTLWVKVKNKWGNTGWISLLPGDYASIVEGRINDEPATTIPSGTIAAPMTSTPAEPETRLPTPSGERPTTKPDQRQATVKNTQPQAMDMNRLKEISKYLQEGKQCFYQGQYELCIAKMEQVLNREPSHIVAQQFIRDAKAHLQK